MNPVTENHSPICEGSARFTVLSDGLIRMEYDPQARFEDRGTTRVPHRPPPVAPTRVERLADCLTVCTPLLELEYWGGPFGSGTLQIRRAGSGETLWRPGQIDSQNLGGVHLAMDAIQRGFIPRGVHPETGEEHANDSQWNLWKYVFADEQSKAPDAHYEGGLRSLAQILARYGTESLSPALQELIRERSKFPPGLLSRAGWYLFNNSGDAVLASGEGELEERREGVVDWYFFAYGNDFRKALADARTLFGPVALPARTLFGVWFSRYPTFAQAELEQVIRRFEAENIPLDVIVLDLEWHQRGWFGYDWDPVRFPDPDGLIRDLHRQDMMVTLNLHPVGIPADDSRFEAFVQRAGIEIRPGDINPDWPVWNRIDLSNFAQARAFHDEVLGPVFDQGVDFWWIDGDARSTVRGATPQFWTNEVYLREWKRRRPRGRPTALTRSAGMGSHRHGIHFTGDTFSHWEVLENQVEYTVRAGHMGQSFLSHDIGGHICPTELVDPELYARWVQFGALSPIFRLHSAPGSERLPWLYGQVVLNACRDALQRRMELLPTLYSLAHESHISGLPMCRSMALTLPEDPVWDTCWDQYFLGEDFLVAPVCQPGGYREVRLPRGTWWDNAAGIRLTSDGTHPHVLWATLKEGLPSFHRGGSLLVVQPRPTRAAKLPDHWIVEIHPAGHEATSSFVVSEDDGMSDAFERGGVVRTLLEYRETAEGHFRLQITPLGGEEPAVPKVRQISLRFPGIARPVVQGSPARPLDHRPFRLLEKWQWDATEPWEAGQPRLWEGHYETPKEKPAD